MSTSATRRWAGRLPGPPRLVSGTGTFGGTVNLDSTTGNRLRFINGSEFAAIYSQGSTISFEFGAARPMAITSGGVSLTSLLVNGGITLAAADKVQWGTDWAIASGPTTDGSSLIFNYLGTRKFHFSHAGKGVADDGWFTFSPKPDKPAEAMSARDWIQWGAADALKPVKPYSGIPTEDHPLVVSDARRLKQGRAAIAQREFDLYAKDISRIAIGTVRWGTAVQEAVEQADDFADFKRRLSG